MMIPSYQDKRMIVDAVSDAVGLPQFALAVQSSLFEILRKAQEPALSSERKMERKMETFPTMTDWWFGNMDFFFAFPYWEFHQPN
jgi:hypothetical protein